MIAIFNSIPVNEGAADKVVEMFANSRGAVQNFPGFVSMEVLRSEGADEVLVVTRWQSRKAFGAWVGSEQFKEAHAGSGGDGNLFRGRPNMSTYEVAIEREPSA